MGAVVVLGKVGRHGGAGMTGGLGYFLDEEGNFPEKVNSEIVSVQRVITDAGAAQLRSLIEQHAHARVRPRASASSTTSTTTCRSSGRSFRPAKRTAPRPATPRPRMSPRRR